jgi:hypothetical protein
VGALEDSVYIDRPDFILNPTNCNPMSIQAAIQGAGLSSVRRKQ